MGRNNKTIDRIFSEIVPSNGGDLYDNFFAYEKAHGIVEDETLSAMKSFYKFLIDSHKTSLENIAAIEEVIVQIRSKHAIDKELRLSLSRNYIYARSIFYRRGFEIHDIRVIVGKTEDHGSDLDSLILNQDFRDMAKKKLIELMDSEIESNIKQLQTVISYEEN